MHRFSSVDATLSVEIRAPVQHNLNTVGTEALAAASRLDAKVVLSAPSPRLLNALEAEGRTATVIS